MFCGAPYYTCPDAFYVLIRTVIFKLKFFVFNNILFCTIGRCIICEHLRAWLIIENTE